MKKAAVNREKYLHDQFFQKRSRLDDYDDDDGDLDEAISFDKTNRKKTIGQLMNKTQKHTNSRYMSESRYAGAQSEYDRRNATAENENVRLQMYGIEKKLANA